MDMTCIRRAVSTVGLTAALAIAAFATTDRAAGQAIFTIADDDILFRSVDVGTGATFEFVVLQLPGRTVEEGRGLAAHPGTGVIYGLLQLAGQTGSELVTIDRCTGVCTSIGNTDPGGFIELDAIAFNADGSMLLGVSDSSSAPANTL